MRLEDAIAGGHLTDHDRREVDAFRRFLALGDEAREIPRRAAGWLPYVLGAGPPPPVGWDPVHPTAWRYPS